MDLKEKLKSFGISEEAIEDVIKVLEFGDVKHPGQPWKKMDRIAHLAHAHEHILHGVYKDDVDDESKLSNLSHSIVRLFFALTQDLSKEDKNVQR